MPEAEARCAADKNRDCQTLVIGGKYLIVGSAEYEYYFKPNWGIATFVDTGDAFSTFDDYRQKIGVGIRRALALAGRHGPRRPRFSGA